MACSNESETPKNRVRGALSEAYSPNDCLSAGSGESGDHPKSAVMRNKLGGVK